MINKLIIDSTQSTTDLCKLGITFPTDKSPYNPSVKLYRHAYTAIYDFLFSSIRNNELTLCEIGIYENKSIQCWRNYFPHATIYGFEYNTSFIDNAKKDNLTNVIYDFIDVKDPNSIDTTFGRQNKTFDIIIDDSTHEVNDQLNIINMSYKYLKTGGYLIIEDIFKSCDLNIYSNFLDGSNCKFKSRFVVDANHSLMHSGNWDNDRLLILTK